MSEWRESRPNNVRAVNVKVWRRWRSILKRLNQWKNLVEILIADDKCNNKIRCSTRSRDRWRETTPLAASPAPWLSHHHRHNQKSMLPRSIPQEIQALLCFPVKRQRTLSPWSWATERNWKSFWAFVEGGRWVNTPMNYLLGASL